MSPRVAFVWLLVINALLAAGDYLAKLATIADRPSTWIATGNELRCCAFFIWAIACALWLPVMSAKGFTKLVALADVLGLLMLAVVGYVFLGERLNMREGAGVGFAVLAVLLLGG